MIVLVRASRVLSLPNVFGDLRQADLRSDDDALDRLAKRQLAPITFDQGNRLRRAVNALTYLELNAADSESYIDLLSAVVDAAVPSIKSAPMPRKRRSSSSANKSKDLVVAGAGGVAVNDVSEKARRKSCTVL
jgi:hypothetical protein